MTTKDIEEMTHKAIQDEVAGEMWYESRQNEDRLQQLLKNLEARLVRDITQHHEAEVERAYERGVADGIDKPLLAIENVREAERERIVVHIQRKGYDRQFAEDFITPPTQISNNTMTTPKDIEEFVDKLPYKNLQDFQLGQKVMYKKMMDKMRVVLGTELYDLHKKHFEGLTQDFHLVANTPTKTDKQTP